MLDDLQPPARKLAQMQAFTRKAKLPDDIAVALAMRPKLTAKAAEAMEDGLLHILTMAETAKLDRGEAVQIAIDIMREPPEGAAPETNPEAFLGVCLDEITARWRAKDPMPNATIGPRVRNSWDQGEGLRAKMVDGLSARIDRRHEPTMGREFAQMSLGEMAFHVAKAEGLKPFNVAEGVRMAAHSSSDFPLILEDAMSNAVARGIEQRQPDIARASHEVAREDYRESRSLTLSATGMPQEVGEGAEIKFVTAEEKGEILPTVRDFASGFNITNQALVNDHLDLLTDIARKMERGAGERFRAVLLEPLLANSGAGQTMADGLTMFHATHGNLAGTGAALSIPSLSGARLAMRKQKGLNGELFAIEPWGMVVPAELETAAQQVLAEIQAAKSSDANPFSGALELIVEPGLTDPAAWYLVGNPATNDGLAHAFLDGQRTPRVESRPGWNTLGMEFRLTWAIGASFIETATWFRNPGA